MSRFASRLAGFFFALVTLPIFAAPTVINEEAKLTGPTAGGELSGSTVSISGDTAVIGAPAENGGRGAAYIFSRDVGGWTLQQRVEASDGLAGDLFGTSVSISGDHVAIGAPGRAANRGAVYTFARVATLWSESGILVSTDGAGGDQFGFSVSLQGLTLVAGAPLDDVNGKTDTGSAYVFTNNGTAWSQFFHIQITTGQVKPGDHLGWSVALSGNTVLVGAPDDDFGNKTDSGSMYVFVRSGNRFARQARLNPAGAAGDRWGSAVALFSNTALVGADGTDGAAGADQGAAIIYTRTGTTWTAAPARLTAADAAAGDRFGASVALSGPLAVVGAPFADGIGADSGKGYVFGNSGAGYTQIDTLVATDNAAGDNFGASAALDAGRAIVGAPRADHPGVDSGAAYVFLLVQPSTTTITSITPEPSVTGQSYSVTVTVAAPSGTPGGTVDVSDGDAASCTITLAAGTGSCSLTSIAAFLHTISASYSGTIVFGASLDTEPHLVNKADTTVSILSDTPDPSLVGEAVTVDTAIAVSSPGAGTPTGTVVITGTNTAGCTVDLAIGTSCKLTFTAVGAQTITATYSGDDDFNGSDNSAAPESHLVVQAQTTLAMTSANNPSVTGESVTLTATLSVTPPAAGPPAGAPYGSTVSFFNGTMLIGTASVNASGVATLTTVFNAVGTFALHAEFAGDANYAASISPDQSHVVNQAATTTAVVSTPNPSSVGESVTLSATVSVTTPGGGTPTGSVEFFNGATSLGTGMLNASGVATLGTSFANAGTFQLHAVYAGDANYTGSTSPDQAHVVGAASTTTTITADMPDASTAGNGYLVSVTVTSAFGATPTGSVVIDDGNGGTCTIAALSAGAGSCTVTSTTVGVLTLTATYTPDVADFTGSSDTEGHTVNAAGDAIFKDSFE
jgi:hypothetical protein